MKNEYEITINKIELASELAHERLSDMIEDMKYEYDEIYEESEEEMRYTDKGQDEFNELYSGDWNLAWKKFVDNQIFANKATYEYSCFHNQQEKSI
jgi:hypothetical protein